MFKSTILAAVSVKLINNTCCGFEHKKMPKLLRNEDYYRVIAYKKDLSMTNIAIAEELNIRRQTVAAILKRNELTGSPLAEIKGRKRKTKIRTTPEEDVQIQTISQQSPFKTPKVIKQELNLRCSVSTVKRRLRDAHLHGRRAAVKVFLTDEAKEKRLRFCKQNKRRNWKKVMYSDEVLIQTSAHGMTWVRRPEGSRYDEQYIREVNRQGRCRVMVWGAITSDRILDLVIIPGRLNKHNYIRDILEPVVKPYHDQHPDMVYQQDNASSHTAHLVTNWFTENNIQLLKWPAQSPDLNIIENLWDILKEEIGDLNNVGPLENARLIDIVNDAWDRVRNRPNLLTKLYRSAKVRINTCIRKKGGHLKW